MTTKAIDTPLCAFYHFQKDFIYGTVGTGRGPFYGAISILKDIADVANLSLNVSSLDQKVSALLLDIEVLMNPLAANTSFSYTYYQPTINSTAAVQSSFGAVMGNPNISSSTVGKLYRQVANISKLLTTFSSLLTLNASGLSQVSKLIEERMGSFIPSNNAIATYKSRYFSSLIASLLAYRILILVIFLLAILTGICMRVRNFERAVNYSCCSLFTITSVTLLLGLVLLAYINYRLPALYMSCEVATTALESPANFDRTDISYVDFA